MSKKLFDLLFNKPEVKSKIVVEIDEENKRVDFDVEGSVPSVLTALTLLVNELKEHNIPLELIKEAVEIGLEEEKMKVKEVRMSKENEEELKKVLDKVLKGE